MSVLCKSEEIIVDTNDYNSDEADDNIRLTLEDSGGEGYHPNYHSETVHITSPRQHNQHLSSTGFISGSGKGSSKNVMENEKRMRREIANSNERRRMQSINAGFQSLRSLLPHHEGEKLSKAAILQQTAQYIIELEREKTHLLSQNSQLKRVLGQHDGGNGGGGGNDTITTAGAIKKRKLTDTVMTMQTISDSSDEGLGSMSPEPVTLLTNGGNKTVAGTAYINTSNKEINDLKARLENERKRRSALEDRLRQYERQVTYPNQFIQREVIEHTDNLRDEDMSVSFIPDPLKLQVVEIDSLPSVGQTQVVVCSSLDDIHEEETETITEEIIHTEEVVIRDDTAEYVEVPSRLQPILEAAIKAEPKVEVERINATLTKIKEEPGTGGIVKEGGGGSSSGSGNGGNGNGKQGNSRMYLTSTSRQNLETIVEAIRHLEGDHLFGDMAEKKAHAQQQQKHPAQEAPLALTNKPPQRKQLPVELSPFLQLKKPINGNNNNKNHVLVSTAVVTSLQTTATNNISCNNSNSISNSNSIMGTNSNNSISINNTNGSSTLKVHQQHQSSSPSTTSSSISTVTLPHNSTSVTIAAALKQCRPGVIVAKQIS